MSRITTFDVQTLLTKASTPTVTPTGGAAGAFGYKVVAKGVGDRVCEASDEGATAVGPTTLDATHYNTVSWGAVTGATGYSVYRTSGGATQGLIGETDDETLALVDDGLVGDAATPPSVNTTGIGGEVGVLTEREKTVQIGGTFVATVQLQGTVDGTNWVNEGGSASAPAVAEVTKTYQAMRVKMTAYTSGTPTVSMASHHGD